MGSQVKPNYQAYEEFPKRLIAIYSFTHSLIFSYRLIFHFEMIISFRKYVWIYEAQDEGIYDPTGLLHDHEGGTPVLTIIDGSPHTLAFIGSALDSPSINLGVDTVGQSGSRDDLYGLFGIDTQGIYAAALGVVDRQRRRRI